MKPAPALTAALTILGLLKGDAAALPPGSPAALMQVLNLANRHGVSPALAACVVAHPESRQDWKSMLPLLRPVADQAHAEQARLLSTACRISSAFGNQGIAAVFLKGLAFLLEAPAGSHDRVMTDIDVLIRPEDARIASNTLQSAGFRMGADLGGFAEGVHHHLPAFHDDASGVFVELHLRLAQYDNESPLRAADVFRAVDTVTRDGLPFLIPSPTHRMVHLIAHAQLSNAGHALRQITLKDGFDALVLSQRHAIDWPAIRSTFSQVGAEQALLAFLLTYEEALGLPFPYGRSGLTRAAKWSREALDNLGASHPMRHGFRLLQHYASLYARHPSRAVLALRTLRDPARLRDLLRINRDRMH